MQAKMNFAQLKIWRPGQAGNFNISYWRTFWMFKQAIFILILGQAKCGALVWKIEFWHTYPPPPSNFWRTSSRQILIFDCVAILISFMWCGKFRFHFNITEKMAWEKCGAPVCKRK
jgi:hypothetical protein